MDPLIVTAVVLGLGWMAIGLVLRRLAARRAALAEKLAELERRSGGANR